MIGLLQAQNILTGIMVAGFAVFFVVGLFDMALVQGDAQRTLWCVPSASTWPARQHGRVPPVAHERAGTLLKVAACALRPCVCSLFAACCRGALCVAILMVYYSAPMSTLYKVIKERSSASLHWLLCLMNSINGGAAMA